MKTAGWVAGLALAGSLAANAADVVIHSFDTGGTLTFNEVSNATGYRVEWASSPGGAWTNFAAASARLDSIPHTGSGSVTASVPLWFRVVATVTNPPAPPGMVLIPAGTFRMGNATNVFPSGEGYSDELPQHTVYVSAFYLDIYEVTKAQWDEVRTYGTNNGYNFSNEGSGKATNHPVHTMNWYDAVRWCNARSQKDGLTPVYYTDAGFSNVYRTNEVTPYANWAANGYRLPTEAEWEKAARGGVANHRFPWSDADTIQHSRANYNSSADYSYDTSLTRNLHPDYSIGGFPCTSPVGSFLPNDYGLYDMAGNVWEWCWDWYDGSYYGSSPLSDPRGAASGTARQLRGGSWINKAKEARCACRNFYFLPDEENYVMGFRCARGL